MNKLLSEYQYQFFLLLKSCYLIQYAIVEYRYDINSISTYTKYLDEFV